MTRFTALELLEAEVPPYDCPKRQALVMAIAALLKEADGPPRKVPSVPERWRELRARITETRAALDRLDYALRALEGYGVSTCL